MISCIVAMDRNRTIGVDNKLPWHLPADLKRLKALTMGHPIVMGRKTYESIGRPLPGRTNIIVTRQRDYRAEGCTVVHSLDEALSAAGSQSEVFILGGADLYRQALSRSDKLYITEVDTRVDGDAFFPEIDPAQWEEIERESHQPDEKNRLPYSYVTLQRRSC